MGTDDNRTVLRGLALLIWRPGDSRLRTLWRVLVPVGGVLAVVFGFPSVVRSLRLSVPVQSLLIHTATALVAVVLVSGIARYARRQDVRSYGFRWSREWWQLLGLGIGVGFFGAGGALLTNLAFGWASADTFVTPGSDDTEFFLLFSASVLTWLVVAFWEELVFRGLFIRETVAGLTDARVSTRWGLVGGWLASAAVFGFLHFNQASSLWALSFWVLGGLVFGAVYILTGELAMPMGIHLGFNVGATNLFGLTSVQTTAYQAPTLIRPTFTGPELFVNLSGVVNTAWLLVMGGLSLVVLHWQLGGLRPRLGE